MRSFLLALLAVSSVSLQAVGCEEDAYECNQPGSQQHNPSFAQSSWSFQGSSQWEYRGNNSWGGGGYVPDFFTSPDPHAHLNNLFDTYAGSTTPGTTFIDSYRDNGSGDGFNVVVRDGVQATEKYFVQGGRNCQTNYDSSGNVTYQTAGCDE